MNRSRLPIVIVLLVSLLGAHFTRTWAISSRSTTTAAGGTSASGLSRMNSFALALMLGGLRGPLVMFLWPSAERQKNEKNLEDFDTKIEWIRLLQAEFDSVHIFQIWNKAYNISVQMANVGNKYVTILDALDYGRNVDAERPNNINILTAIAQLFGEKLGRSDEKLYYQQRVRDETQARRPMVRITVPTDRRAELEKRLADAGLPPPRLRVFVDDSANTLSVTVPKTVADEIQPLMTGPNITFADRSQVAASGTQLRRRELDPILDTDGRILPAYAEELRYLKEFEPFPYGVSPHALGFNYFKRAQVLQRVNKQKHAQLTDTVVDRNPPLALREWSLEEWERGRRAEVLGLGLSIPGNRMDLETVSAETLPDAQVVYPSLIDEAIYTYDRASQLIDIATREYRHHMEYDKSTFSTYVRHLDEIHAQQELMRGDRDYLRLMRAPEREQDTLRADAIKHYQETVRQYRVHALTYWVSDEIAAQLYPANVNKANIAQANLEPDVLESLVSTAYARIQDDPYASGYEEIAEFNVYISRALARLNNLGAAQ